LIGKNDLVEGNSKLAATAAVAEFGGFSIAGWLVQVLTAPLAILIDAGSFLVSAIAVWLIRTPEPAIIPREHGDMGREIAEGLRTVWTMPVLRGNALAVLIFGFARGIFGALVVLYMSRGLGFKPGILGMIWAVGGISALLGATFTVRITQRIGAGPAMIIGLIVFGVLQFFIPLANGPTVISALLLVAQQIGDGFYMVYEINQVSIRQLIVSEGMLGRVNATFQFLSLGTTLVGSLSGGALGELLGVRLVLVLGACVTLLAAATLALSPLRTFKGAIQGAPS
jgi:hypothetical protein